MLNRKKKISSQNDNDKRKKRKENSEVMELGHPYTRNELEIQLLAQEIFTLAMQSLDIYQVTCLSFFIIIQLKK